VFISAVGPDLAKEGRQLVTNCHRIKLAAADGKMKERFGKEVTTSTAPRLPLADLVKIRHHQAKSRANELDGFALVMAATLTGTFSEAF
jgi:hypothetical protein